MRIVSMNPMRHIRHSVVHGIPCWCVEIPVSKDLVRTRMFPVNIYPGGSIEALHRAKDYRTQYEIGLVVQAFQQKDIGLERGKPYIISKKKIYRYADRPATIRWYWMALWREYGIAKQKSFRIVQDKIDATRKKAEVFLDQKIAAWEQVLCPLEPALEKIYVVKPRPRFKIDICIEF